ncbi:restriction endonuclease subunit S [Helicobacter pylori]
MIRTTNFENNDFKNDLIYIDKKAYEFLSKSKVFAGDILVNKIANAGTAYFMPKLNQPVSLGMNLFLLRIKPSYNNLFIFKQIANYERVLKTFANGSATKTITKNVIKNLLIPLPPLNEQIAIANILSDVDRYLYSLDALILKKESVKKALSFELLSQRKRLKGFNQAWQKVRLGDICEIVKGQQINKISLNNTDKYPVINGGIDFLGYTNKFNVSKNTIAISEGGTCGYVRFMTSDFWSGGHNYSLQKISNKVNNLCLYHILKSYEKDIMKLGVGSGLKNIQLKALKDFEIPLPPLNEQIAIANILSGLDSEIISLKNKKRQFENIKKALNHDLMSAKIRVLKK